MRGKRKPRALKLLEGNPGHDSKANLDPSREPQYKTTARGGLKAPGFLGATGKDEWKRLAGELARIGLFQTVDRAALACYCAAYSDLKSARDALNKLGRTYEVHNEKTGTVFINQRPELGIANKAADQIAKFAREFGLSPNARGRIEIPEIEKKDALWEALRKPRKIDRPSE